MDWQVGDVAMCVDDDDPCKGLSDPPWGEIVEGQRYTVIKVTPCAVLSYTISGQMKGHLTLLLLEVKNRSNSAIGFDARRFVKQQPLV
mgnify:FL=1